jgi:hypothetical protein
MNIVRTNSDNPDFLGLVQLLDADLAIRDGELHSFYGQFNKLDKIKFVVVAYDDGKPLGCGAIKEYDDKYNGSQTNVRPARVPEKGDCYDNSGRIGELGP